MQGTAVTAHGFGLLLVGSSGSGKSTLALQMMSLGAGLISDDIVALDQVGSVIAVAITWARLPNAPGSSASAAAPT